jgi:hypothetical protein
MNFLTLRFFFNQTFSTGGTSQTSVNYFNEKNYFISRKPHQLSVAVIALKKQ